MADAVTDFFEHLGSEGFVPLLSKVTGTVRVELTEGTNNEIWNVALDKGAVTVSRDGADADCRVRGDRALFGRLARGEENVMAVVLRGLVACSGDIDLLFAFQRIFPGPPDQRRPEPIGRSSRWEP